MSQTIYQMIQKYLTDDNWKFQIRDDQSLILSFYGENSDMQIPLVIRVTEHWISFTAYMLLGSPNDDVLMAAAIKIGEWNYLTKMVKFALTPDRGIILGAEIPLGSITAELFNRVLDTLCYYSDYAYPHLMDLWQSCKEN